MAWPLRHKVNKHHPREPHPQQEAAQPRGHCQQGPPRPGQTLARSEWSQRQNNRRWAQLLMWSCTWQVSQRIWDLGLDALTWNNTMSTYKTAPGIFWSVLIGLLMFISFSLRPWKLRSTACAALWAPIHLKNIIKMAMQQHIFIGTTSVASGHYQYVWGCA